MQLRLMPIHLARAGWELRSWASVTPGRFGGSETTTWLLGGQLPSYADMMERYQVLRQRSPQLPALGQKDHEFLCLYSTDRDTRHFFLVAVRQERLPLADGCGFAFDVWCVSDCSGRVLDERSARRIRGLLESYIQAVSSRHGIAVIGPTDQPQAGPRMLCFL